MNKKDYLDLLRYYLRDLPKSVVEDIVSDYEEHFDIAISEGKSESQIAFDLGSPEDIANEYLSKKFDRNKINRNNKINNKLEKPKKNEKSEFEKLIIIIILIISFPGILGLIVGVIWIIIGLFMGLIGMGVGLLGGAIGIIAKFLGVGMISMPSSFMHTNFMDINIVTRVFLIFALISFGLLLLKGAFTFINFVIKTIKDVYISIKWRLEK